MKRSLILTPLLLLALLPTPCGAEDPPVFLLKWGSQGSGPGQFQNPIGIGVGPGGDIYVVDAGLNRVQRFTSTGDFVCTVGSYGSGDGQFHSCFDIAFGPDNLGYVSDFFNGRFQVFDTDCSYIRQWTVPNSYASTHVAINPTLGRVYTTASDLVLMYDTTGTYLGNWSYLGGAPPPGPQPFGVGPSGTLYFPDTHNHLVVAFGPPGYFVRSWGEHGVGPGQLDLPYSVAVDANEDVYVMDHHRVQKFTSTGQFLTSWGSAGSGDGQFSNLIADICVDADGNVYVLDAGHYWVQKFGQAPTPVIRRTWGKLKQRYR